MNPGGQVPVSLLASLLLSERRNTPVLGTGIPLLFSVAGSPGGAG